MGIEMSAYAKQHMKTHKSSGTCWSPQLTQHRTLMQQKKKNPNQPNKKPHKNKQTKNPQKNYEEKA